MTWLRRHFLAVAVAVAGLVIFGVFTWAEYGYFCDQASDHHQSCQGFWSLEHLHDWIYNTASNWQSELLMGVLFVILLRNLRHTGDDEV